ncbi:xanthine dehydrogenase family protein subunit M [Ammoniphilus sp. YIM 78166]|uniref:FAD binding domain-containing protein n=1 Tax=Ammoniphilus sp. YIM 78166 TaxID=1644106 RepID=UPI00106F296E|nr:FAD binding domain-containing protein [Ammoniphilus sp. YIM 78166]
MIPYDFNYYLPSSIREAIEIYHYLESKGQNPVYYGGGTEIITLGRLNLVPTRAVIDIRDIPESQILGTHHDHISLGAALSLTRIEEANVFPLLTKISSEVADHTARNKITLGGNICGRIFYREAVLPFLLTDSEVLIAGPRGVHYFPLHERFDQHLRLDKGEFLVLLRTKREDTGLPYVAIKRRQQWETGYPLVTIAAIKKESHIRVAFSGVCPFPFRSRRLEEELNNPELPMNERVRYATRHLPSPILNDVEGSSDFRLFVIQNLLVEILTTLGGDRDAKI